ncbi:hypothetical protein M3Y97_00822200 [Aphelenchoides bicaudatus]|nr:hypothetical protein M3Y97_00822200 [Aphelenchoides bicaudatus]
MHSIFVVLIIAVLFGLSVNSAPLADQSVNLTTDVSIQTCKQSTINLLEVDESFFVDLNVTNMLDLVDLDEIMPKNGFLGNANVSKDELKMFIIAAGGPRKFFETVFGAMEKEDTDKAYNSLIEEMPDELKSNFPETAAPEEVRNFSISCFSELSDTKLDRILYGKN